MGPDAIMKTKELAQGKWDEIYSALGISVGTGKHQPCPVCHGRDRFRLIKDHPNGEYYCNGCKPGDGLSLVMKYFNIDYKSACEKVDAVLGVKSSFGYDAEAKRKYREAKEQYKKNKDRLIYLWKNSKRLTGKCDASLYLKRRGLSVIPDTAALRYIESCHEPDTGKKYSAMLSTFYMPGDKAEAVTIHRTYLNGSGKAPIEKPRKLMPGLKQLAGGAVRLFECNDVLGVAEGVETAIAAHELWDIPVWATLSTSLMESFEPPRNIKHILIFADKDMNYAGERAAYVLANRLCVKNKIHVDVEVPKLNLDQLEPGQKSYDWLDVLNNKGV